MLEKLTIFNKSNLKKANAKAFLFFLVFSALIWILVQFAKNYQQVVSVKVNFTNIPKDKIITEKNTSFQVRLTGKGYQLAWFGISTPSISIDLSKLTNDEHYLYYVLNDKKFDLAKSLDFNAENLVFLEKQLKVPYVQKAVKKVPVISQIQVGYSPGYSSREELKLTPDSLKISGRKDSIDSINAVRTQPINLRNVKSNQHGSVNIDTTGLKEITLYEPKVDYELSVEKFTEGRIEVPIEILNAPDQANISIFPKKIMVIFKVSLAQYNQIDKSDFKVVCDFKNLMGDQNFVIPKLVEKPKSVTSYRLNTNKVQFVIKK